MRINSTCFFLHASVTYIQAQTDVMTDPRFERFQQKVAESKGITLTEHEAPASANQFFRTYEDFVNGVPVPDLLLHSGL